MTDERISEIWDGAPREVAEVNWQCLADHLKREFTAAIEAVARAERPSFTRERVAAALRELCLHDFSSRSDMVDELCRLLGVEEQKP